MKRGPSDIGYGTIALAVACLALLTPGRSHAQPEIIAKFLSRSHTFGSATLVYRLFIPAGYTPSKQYPIVLALHGNTAQGSDNLIHIQDTRLATSWADSVNQSQYPCFVVAPQCRAGFYWDERGPDISPDLATANNLLDSLAREFSIDTTRMYVTGFSMGGFASWDLASIFPGRFAAVVPVSAGWWSPGAFRIGDIPIWTFHGAADGIVPVEWVREIIGALEQRGRSVTYTHCYKLDCTGLSDSVIAGHVRSHADLFYTELQFGDHGKAFSTFAFDHPQLRPWLFDKIRLTRGLVRLTNTGSYRTLRGTESITWTAATPSDSVQIRFSPDGGFTWRILAQSIPNTGGYNWNTQNEGDCAFGLLKIVLKNPQGQSYGYDQSAYFAIDNSIQGEPFAKILNPHSFLGRILDDTSATELQYLAGSSKPGPLTVRYHYSADGGATFTQFDSSTTQGDTTGRTRMLNLSSLANSEKGVIRIDVSDGVSVSSDTTSPLHPLAKRTPRGSGPVPSKVDVFGSGTVSVRVVDASKLTGDLYRVSFHTTPGLGTTYDVLNDTKSVRVAQNAHQLDGATEGPLFDGMRLVVWDYPKAEINRDSTRWEAGVPTLLDVQIGIPSSTLGGMAYPADYRITFYNQIVDTSSEAILGMGMIPVNFTVFNMTENRKSEFIFIDSDNNQQVSGLDDIVILETDSLGTLRLTWDLLFVPAPPATSVPGPGDQLVVRTFKPFRPGDSFTFQGSVTSISTTSLPDHPTLFQNFPNPFNPTTMIRYDIPEAGSPGGGVASNTVKLVVYDILGRQVTTLVNERKTPGSYQVAFNAAGLASGVYLYRLTAGSFVQTRKLLLVR